MSERSRYSTFIVDVRLEGILLDDEFGLFTGDRPSVVETVRAINATRFIIERSIPPG